MMSSAMVSIVLASVSGGPRPAAANPLKSELTAIELKNCQRMARHRDGGAWRCPGLPGYPVYFAEGDLRQMLAFGTNAEKRRSATQTLGAFNTIFDGHNRPTIEWRVEHDLQGRARPYATIVRFHTSRDGTKGEVLVITKVDAQISCRIAVVDASANADAMAMAREWSDVNARKLACPETPQVLGRTGQSPM